MSALADTAYRWSMKVQDDLDTEAKIEEARRGAKDGANKALDHQTLFAPTIRGQAYTESALRSYQQRVDLDMRQALNDLEGKHATDPAGYQRAVNDYAKGLMEGLLDEQKPIVEAELKVAAQAGAARIDKSAAAIRQAQVDGNIAALEVQIERDVTAAAGTALSNDPKLRAASQRYVMFQRERLAAQYNSTFVDRYGNEIPLYSSEKRTQAMEEFDQTVLMSSMRGWFMDAVESSGPLGAVSAMSALTSGKGPTIMGPEGEPIHVYGELKDENRLKLLGEVRAQIGFMNGQESHRQSQFDRAIEKYNEVVEREFLQASTEQRMSIYLDMLRDPNVDPTLLNRMDTHFKNDLKESDRYVLRDTRLKIYTGEIKSWMDIPIDGISSADEGTLMSLLETQTEKDYFSNTNDFKAARDMLRNFYKIPVGSTLVGVDASVQAGWFGQDMNELYDIGLGGELKPTTFTDRAKQLIERAKTERRTVSDRMTELTEQYQKVLDDPTMTEEHRNEELGRILDEQRKLRRALVE